ncbi:MAG: hypothetical protein GY838_07780 [bacterium]|nr:hypothetical protein [bacterium]
MNHETSGGPAQAQTRPLTLPSILNVLWRARLLAGLVTLAGVLAGVAYGILAPRMYEATGQVRPGVVSFAGDGTPLRESALKDVVRWFRSNLFWPVMRELPDFADRKTAPVIDAEFIPAGVQFDAGGDVIILTTFDQDAARAVTILNESVKAFNRRAEEDTLRGTIALTRGGALVRQAKIQADLDFIAAKTARNSLAIAAQERELAQVETRSTRLDMRLERLAQSRATRERAVVATEAEAEAARGRLAEARQLLSRTLAAEGGAAGGVRNADAVTEVLLQTASREQAGRVGDLLVTVNELSATIYTHTLAADTLRDAMAGLDEKIADLRLVKSVDLAKSRADIQQRISDLHLVAEHDLPLERARLEADYQAEQVRIDQLTPLERVGRITVSAEPVRPRKLRATAILTALALCGGLFLAFAREYFRRNRAEILADGDR